MEILVTGSNGFIGSYLTPCLKKITIMLLKYKELMAIIFVTKAH